MAAHLERGRNAERLAAEFLAAQGLRPVAANFRTALGELDLVMRHGECLVIVEVRFRRSAAILHPAASVNRQKQRRIIQATRIFLKSHPAHAGRPVRFDVVAIVGPAESPSIRWLAGAFTLDDVATAGR